VCSRAKNHFDPTEQWDVTEDSSVRDPAKAADSLDKYQKGFKPLHSAQKILMYFSVRNMQDSTFFDLMKISLVTRGSRCAFNPGSLQPLL